MRKITILITLFLIVFYTKGQNVGIGNTNPHPSAVLDISDSTKGVLIPRMTFTQRNGIQNPALGLMLYQTDSIKGYWFYDGQLWKHLFDFNGVNQGDMMYWNGSSWARVPSGLHGQSLYFCNGIPSWGGCTPLITTAPISDITTSSALSGGNITSDGGSVVTSRGIVWNTSPNPTISLSTKTNNGTGTGIFSSNLTNLNSNTQYYVRAYAINSNGTSYGNQLIFNTNVVSLPTIITATVTDTTSNSANSGGNIINDGGATIISRGVVWDTISMPTISLNTKTVNGSGSGTFLSTLSGLIPSKNYFIRAYAINSAGVSYGNQLTFRTANQVFSIGQNYQGGVIGYIFQPGDPGYISGQIHGIIAATSDQNSIYWGCDGTLITGADNTAIGSGYQNTLDILSGCAVSGIAAESCFNAQINGYSNWFLPSKEELNKLYLNKSLIGGFSQNFIDYYWSSSEWNSTAAWVQYFSNGGQAAIQKSLSNIAHVRAIRYF